MRDLLESDSGAATPDSDRRRTTLLAGQPHRVAAEPTYLYTE